MHILVTGATGFIGSYFVLRAMAQNHEITIVRRSSNSKPAIHWPTQPHWLESDLLSLGAHQLCKIDAIAHFAATGVSPRTASWGELEEINIKGTLYLCKLAKELGVRITISGSYAEYGLSGNQYLLIPSWAALEPTFPYAASKAAASVLATSFARSEGIELAYLRIFNAFGIGQYEGNLWPSLRNAATKGEDFALTLGEQIRDFIDVNEVAEWFIHSLTSATINTAQPLVANVGSGRPQSIIDFCRFWWKEWGAPGKLVAGAIPYRQGEVMRFAPKIDYSPLTP